MKIEGKLGTASRRCIDCGTLTTDLARTHAHADTHLQKHVASWLVSAT